MNRKILKISGIVVGAIILLALIGYGLLRWYLSPKIPNPKSDVPIEHKIDWWAYQEALTLDSFETKVIYDGLNLFNGTSVVEYNIRGSISYKNNWRPYIRSVHISERWEGINRSNKRVGTIVVTPIIAVKNDELYTGEPIEFDLSVQDYLYSGGWGVNLYKVCSMDKQAEIELIHRK